MSYAAEFLGTFLLVLSIFASGGNWLVIGATLGVVVLLIGAVSGGHVNPAVSLAMYMNGSLKPMDLFSYVFAQLLGGASAYYAYKAVKA
jgi:aquaporin Z